MPISRTGTGAGGEVLLCCEWAWLQLAMYLGTSGRRGTEYFWPAKRRSVTRTDWDKRRRYTEPSHLGCFGSREAEEGAGEKKPQEGQEEQQSCRI